MEVPLGQPAFDLGPAGPRGRQSIGQSLGPSPHLLRLGQPLFGRPTTVAGLQGVGEPAEVAQRQWRDAGADGQGRGAVGPGQLEGAQALEGPTER